MAIPSIPVELHTAILIRLPGHDPSSTKTVVSCLSANSVTRAAALDTTVWANLYRGRYTHAVPEHEEERRARLGGESRAMFVERAALDRQALCVLDCARKRLWWHRPNGGDDEEDCDDLRVLSFDVWDALEIEAAVPVPRVFRDPDVDDMDAAAAADAIPRRYWANAALGAIARQRAVIVWRMLREEEARCTFDDALVGFSAFADNVSPYRIFGQLDELAARCRGRLVDQGVELDSRSSDYDLVRLLVSIRAFIRYEGFNRAVDSDRGNPLNVYPHYFLNEGRSKTLPISINYVFCAICRRLGIQASPTDTRGEASHITSPNLQRGDILLDPCAVTTPPIVFSSRDITVMLREAGMHPSSSPHSVRPAELQSLAVCAMHHLISYSEWRDNLLATAACNKVRYTIDAAFATINRRIVHIVPPVPEDCPLDAQMVVERGIVLDIPNGPQREQYLRELSDDSLWTTAAVAFHGPCSRPKILEMHVFVGQVLSHPEYGLGCVVGWSLPGSLPVNDNNCHKSGAPPIYRLLTENRVQVFTDGDSVRPVPLTPGTLRWLFEHVYMFKRFFVDAHVPRADGKGGRLTPVPELLAQFPDDLEAGIRWSEEQLNLVETF